MNALCFHKKVRIMFTLRSKKSLLERIDSIEKLVFPVTIAEKIKKEHSYATDEAMIAWQNGFKRFLMLQLTKPKGVASLAMPSEAVDAVWHAALLHTRWYQSMCERCLGYFLHHDPFAQNSDNKCAHKKNEEFMSLVATYVLDCKMDKIVPDGNSVPLLFAMDSLWQVSPGYHYGTADMVAAGRADISVSLFKSSIAHLI